MMNGFENFKAATVGANYTPPYECNYLQQVKLGAKSLSRIRICRIPIDINVRTNTYDLPGHYWIEILHQDENDEDEYMQKLREQNVFEVVLSSGKQHQAQKPNGYRESYGWYPVRLPVSFKMSPYGGGYVAIEKKGVLNGDSPSRREKDYFVKFLPSEDRNAGRKEPNNTHSIHSFDPHQNGHFKNNIKTVTTPILLPEDKRSEDDVIKDIRLFSKNFYKNHSERWSWTGDGYEEVNCHTFLFLLLSECKLADPFLALGFDKHFEAYFESLQENNTPDDDSGKRYDLMSNLRDISKRSLDFIDYQSSTYC